MENHKILLVDDDPLILRTVGKTLERKGHEVITAKNGEDAISLMAQETFDLVITDLVMEPVDGIAVLKESRNINPECMVIILTGFGDMATAIDALRLKADDYLLKPCTPDEMDYRINRCFDKQDLKNKIRKIEKRLLKDRLMEMVGRLSGGVSHDFNNMLGSIMGNIELSRNIMQPGNECENLLSEAMNSCMEARDLIKKFLTLSKADTPKREAGVIADTIRNFSVMALMMKNVKCEYYLPEDLWTTDFDEARIGQAISCIITNASEAMPDGGTVKIEADNVIIGDESNIDVDGGQYVKISIKDHGCGISPEDLEWVFDPYFSTKKSFGERGMGLGLATSFFIIKKHEGDIQVESEVNAGTTVNIYLPAYEKEKPVFQIEKVAVSKESAVGRKKILLMDDEESLRFATCALLDILGHNAESCKNGVDAIETYSKAKESGEPFDAVILDLTIQGDMGGEETMQRLLEIDPDVKGIVASGFSFDPVMTRYKEYGFCEALPKPYLKAELAKAIERVFKSIDL